MKKIYILLVMISAIAIIGCDTDECPVCHECECICSNPSYKTENTFDTLKSGTWSITYFLEDGELETSDYYGNSFTYSDSGIVAVSIPNLATPITGTWGLKSGNSHDELYLVFTQSGKLKELNENWDVIEFTSDIIRLEEPCDDILDTTDYLTFSKIE